MDGKTLSLDFLVKSSNLCRFLASEKSETLISVKLFDAVCTLSECTYSQRNPVLSKPEAALLRKDAAISAEKIHLYLDALYVSGYISQAQKDSMLQSLATLKKEINI